MADIWKTEYVIRDVNGGYVGDRDDEDAAIAFAKQCREEDPGQHFTVEEETTYHVERATVFSTNPDSGLEDPVPSEVRPILEQVGKIIECWESGTESFDLVLEFDDNEHEVRIYKDAGKWQIITYSDDFPAEAMSTLKASIAALGENDEA